MKKDNKSQENIYLLMKERLGKDMNEGVEQDLKEFLNFVSKQQQRDVSKTKTPDSDGPEFSLRL